MGPIANILSSPADREYTNLAPAASYVPGALTANSPFTMYEPLDTLSARIKYTYSFYWII